MASTATTAPRQRSNRAILIVAVVCGLITAVLAYLAVTSATESEGRASSNEPAAAAVASEPVVVTSVDIAARTIITADMVTLKQVPREGVQPGAFSSLEEVVGSVAVYPTDVGQQVLANNVSEFGASAALSYLVPEGHRAIGVNATAVKAVGGYILPGDFVDIVGVFKWAGDDDINATATLAQDAEVLAVERTAELLELQKTSDEDLVALSESERTDGIPLLGEENPDALYLVVAVTPEEAKRVFAADHSESAEFRFLLRRTGEHDTRFMPIFVPLFGSCGDTLDSPLYGEIPGELAALNQQELCDLQQAALAAAAEELGGNDGP
jgi:pilus assembly protein CpaB